MSEKQKAKIVGLGSYLPERVLSNADLEKMVETNDEWIVTRTGIRERRLAADDEYSSDMGVIAAKRALEAAGCEANDVDLVLVGTCTPDYLFPSTAAIIQGQLGIEGAAAFDYQAACPGFIYGLSLAKAYIESGLAKRVLLIASEKLSSFVDFTDRATCILFGDGAAAAVITGDDVGLELELVSLGSDGATGDILTLPDSGCRTTGPGCQASIKMEGREVFKHGVRRMAQSAKECLEALELTIDDVAWMVPHQANKRIIDSVAKRLTFPEEKIYYTVQKYGNTSASSVPIALHELLEQETLNQGERILVTSFGAGLKWGSAILKQVGAK